MIRSATKEEINIHFDRESQAVSVRDVVISKVEVMTFIFLDAFSCLRNIKEKQIFLSKLTEGACIEGRMEPAIKYTTDIKQFGAPTFEDLMLEFRRDIERFGDTHFENNMERIFKNYARDNCQPNAVWAPNGKLTQEAVRNYFERILGFSAGSSGSGANDNDHDPSGAQLNAAPHAVLPPALFNNIEDKIGLAENSEKLTRSCTKKRTRLR